MILIDINLSMNFFVILAETFHTQEIWLQK